MVTNFFQSSKKTWGEGHEMAIRTRGRKKEKEEEWKKE